MSLVGAIPTFLFFRILSAVCDSFFFQSAVFLFYLRTFFTH
ncbi:hypothetical protein D347_00794 [Enterococcus faecalis LA3B-2]|nr:hypothetical protein D347_00794 [Enterococcus faecalis LA3B-2]